jgi:hypothetical protein
MGEFSFGESHCGRHCPPIIYQLIPLGKLPIEWKQQGYIKKGEGEKSCKYGDSDNCRPEIGEEQIWNIFQIAGFEDR